MIDKQCDGVAAAVADIFDGAAVMIGGFGPAGMPDELIDALIGRGVGALTLISNHAGNGETGVAAFSKADRVRKIICSFRRQSDSHYSDASYRAGQIELELVPQGNLAARGLEFDELKQLTGMPLEVASTTSASKITGETK